MAWHKYFPFCFTAFASLCALRNEGLAQEASESQLVDRRVMVVVGAAGESEFGASFLASADRWKKAMQSGEVVCLDPISDNEAESKGKSDKDQILEWIESERSRTVRENWLVFIGHGTFDRSGAKFNLKGPDISATEIAQSIKKSSSDLERPNAAAPIWVVVDCSSSSAPFINALSAKSRVIITATKSGSEMNYARFGDYLSQAILDPKSDLDHDHSVSILEAFLAASSMVTKFYEDEGRLASEQALLDDNGDSRGTPAVFYRGIRPVKAPAEGLQLDGSLANQIRIQVSADEVNLSNEMLVRVRELEGQVEKLRSEKNKLTEREYYASLEKLFLEIATLRLRDLSASAASDPQPLDTPNNDTSSKETQK